MYYVSRMDKREHAWSQWPGSAAIRYQWCSICGLFAVVSVKETAYFVLGKPLPVGHLTMDSGLHVDPGCGVSSGDVYLVEMRERVPTQADPYHFDSVILAASQTKGGAIHWVEKNGPTAEEHDPDRWYWFAVISQGVDHDAPYDLTYFDWNGKRIPTQPISGYPKVKPKPPPRKRKRRPTKKKTLKRKAA